MSGLDLILLAGIGFGVWNGMRTGALTQLVGTFGMLLGFVVGAALMGPAGSFLTGVLGTNERIAPVVGFIGAFGAVVLGLHMVARTMRATLKKIKLGGLDTAAGAGVGGIRSAFNLSLLLLMTGASPFPGAGPLLIGTETREASILYPAIEGVAPAVWDAGRTVAPGLQEALLRKFNAEEASPDSTASDEPIAI